MYIFYSSDPVGFVLKVSFIKILYQLFYSESVNILFDCSHAQVTYHEIFGHHHLMRDILTLKDVKLEIHTINAIRRLLSESHSY